MFIKGADLNNIHIQPALIYDENYIYVFSLNNRYYEKLVWIKTQNGKKFLIKLILKQILI